MGARIHNPPLDPPPAPAKGPRSASGVLLNVPRSTTSTLPPESNAPTPPKFLQAPDPVNASLLKNAATRWDPNQAAEMQDPSLDPNEPIEDQEDGEDTFSPRVTKSP